MELTEQFKNFLLSGKNPPSKATVKNYKADTGQFIHWIETTSKAPFNPSEVTAGMIEEYKKFKTTDDRLQTTARSGAVDRRPSTVDRQALSARSFNRHLSSLRKFFHFLKVEGIISHDPLEAMAQVENGKKQMENQDPWRIRQFKDHLYVYNASKLTIKNYIIDVKQFLTWAEEVTGIQNEWDVNKRDILSRITPQLVEEYKSRLLAHAGLSPISINRKLSSLRRYMNWAVQEGLAKNAPAIVSEKITSQNVILEQAQRSDRISPDTSDPIAPALSQRRSLQDDKKTNDIAKSYSSFPPARLAQKIGEAADFVFEQTIVAPVTKVVEQAQEIAWNASGRPVFTQNTDTFSTSSNNTSALLSTDILRATQSGVEKLLQVKNIKKEMYAPLSVSTAHFPLHKKIIHHLRYTRPDWYKKYHSYPITQYFHLGILLVLMTALGFGLYKAFIEAAPKSPLFAAAVAPPRTLSFQGRLTDSLDNPITANKNIRFAIYNDLSATGAALLWQEVNTVSPDTDGIFSIFLGRGTAIPQSLFGQNSALYLGVSVASDSELAPRQQLASVAYATNAELLQGMAPITDVGVTTNTNTILALNSSGTLSIPGVATTTFQATSGQFTLTGQTLVLSTNAGTDGNVSLVPDGLGKIDFQKPLFNSTLNNNISSAKGAVEIDDLFAVLATSSGQSAVTINQDGAGPILSASVAGIAKFTVDNTGNILPGATGTQNIGSPSLFWSNIYVNNLTSPVSGTSGYWQRNGNTISPTNITDDILLGSTATTSALIKFTGTGGNNSYINTGNFGIGTTAPRTALDITGSASLSANISMKGAGTAHTFNYLDNGSLNFQRSPGGDGGLTSVLFLQNNGNVGIGSTGPGATFDLLSTVTTGTAGRMTANSLTTGTLLQLASTSITSGNFFNINNGSDIFTVSNTVFSTSLPSSFTSAGDVSIAYDLNFTNPTSSYIKSASLLYIQAGESFSSSDLILRTFNSGQGVFDFAGGASLIQAQTWTLLTASSSAMTFKDASGNTILNLDSTNDRVGIGTTAPLAALDVRGSSATTPVASISGQTSFAALVVDNRLGDIFTASSSGVSQFVIRNNGAVGIGSTIPGAKLDVVGDGRFSTDLAVNGGDLTSSASTFNLLSATVATLNVGDSAATINLAGGNVSTGCTVDGTSGNLTCSGTINGSASGSSGYWQRILGAGTGGFLAPANISDDILVGQIATPSASAVNYFQIFGVGNGVTGTTGGDASTSGSLTIGTNRSRAIIQTQRNIPLVLGSTTTGSIQLSPAGTTGLNVNITGNVGIGTTVAGSALDVIGAGAFSTDLAVNGSNLTTTTTTTFNLLNTNLIGTLNIAGVAGTINIGPSGATATSINLAGGSGATGCTVDGATGNLACSGSITGASSGASGFWQRILGSGTGGIVAPLNISDDLLIGQVATPSASAVNYFQIFGVGNGVTGTTGGDASTSGSLTLGTNRSLAIIETERAIPLILGSATTGSIQLSPKGTTGLMVDVTGNVGIGTTAPGQALSVAGNILVTTTSNYIGVVDSTHGALLNRKLSIDDGTYVGASSTQTSGCPHSSNAWCFASVNGYDLQVGGSGIGKHALAINSVGNVGIGTTGPVGVLHVTGIAAGNAAAIINQAGAVGDIFTASSSGTPRFVITNAGNVGVGGQTLPLTALDITGSASLSANISMKGAGTAHTFNYLDNGSLNFQRSPGGDAGVASVLYLGNNGNVGIGTTNANSFKMEVAGNLGPEANGTRDLGSATKYWNNLYVNNIISAPSGVSGYWQRNAQTVALTNITDDLLIGQIATPSASATNYFQVFGIGNGATGTTGGDASTSGSLTLGTARNATAAVIQTARLIPLQIGSTTTGSIQLSPAGTVGLNVNTAGNVGIGTTSPGAKLDVNGSIFGTASETDGLKFGFGTGRQYGLSMPSAGNVKITANSGISGTAQGWAFSLWDGASTYTDKVYIDANGKITSQGGVHTISGQIIDVKDSSHGFLVDSAIDGLQFNGFGGFTFKTGVAGATERVRIDSAGNVGIGTTSPIASLDIVGSQNFSAMTAPGAVTAGTPTAGGSCTAGTHYYKATFTSVGSGETTAGTVSNVITCVTTTGQTVPLTAIPTGPAGTISRKIYRTNAGALSSATYYLVGTVADNTTTTFSDTTADNTTTAAPASNTTAVANIQTGGTNRITIDSSGNVGIGTTNPSSFLLQTAGNVGPNAHDTYDLGSAALEWNNIYVKNVISTGTVNGFWQRRVGAISQANITDDLLIGTTATPSASATNYFQIFGGGSGVTGIDTGDASTSGSLTLGTARNATAAVIQTKRLIPLQIGSTTTGSIQLSPAGTVGLNVNTAGNVGIGTTTPLGNLHINGTTNTRAGLLVDVSTSNDIFTASSSGTPRVVINNAGNIGIGSALPAYGIDLVGSKTLRIQGGSLYVQDSVPTFTTSINQSSTISYFANNAAKNMYFATNANGVISDGFPTLMLESGGPAGVGNVGIGTTNPTGLLHVTGISAGNAAAIINQAGAIGDIFTASSSGAPKFVITNAGNVGIGTALPATKLDVVGAGTFSSDLAVNGANLTTTTTTTFNLLNTNLTGTLNLAGVAGTINIGPSGATATSIALAGGSGNTGCTVDGATGNLTCSGSINGSTSSGSSSTWQRILGSGTGGALSPVNITDDVLIGQIATPSASATNYFQIFGGGSGVTGIDTGDASTSGSLTLGTARNATAAVIQTKRLIPLQIGSTTTGSIQLSPAGTVGLNVNTAGNVGIGTTTPSYKLDVQGTIRANSTVYIGQNGASEAALYLGDDGAPTYTKLYRPAGSVDFRIYKQGINADALTILNSNGYVGIGTTNPLTALDVTGSASLSANISLKGAGTAHTFNYLDNGSLNFQRSPGGDAGLASVMYLESNGNVGVGTTNPAATLEVAGTVRIGTSNVTIFNTTGGATFQNNVTIPNMTDSGSGNTWINLTSTLVHIGQNGSTTPGINVMKTGNVGIGTNAPVGVLHVTGIAAGNAAAIINQAGTVGDIFTASASGTPRFVITNAGNVGVGGQTLPLAALDVTGSASLSANISLSGAGTAHTFNYLDNGSLNFQRSPGGDAGVATVMYLGSNGNVGIGTSSPLGLVNIKGSNGGGDLRINETGSNNHLLMYSSDVIQHNFIAGNYYQYTTASAGTVVNAFSANSNSYITGGNLGIGTTTSTSFKLEVGGNIGPSATSTYDLGSSSRYWNNLYVNNIISAGAGIQGYWQRSDQGLAPTNVTDDILIGRVATPSASAVNYFQIFGVGNGVTGTTGGDASTSGSLTLGTNRSLAIIETERGIPLILGSTTTGSVQLSPKGTTGLMVDVAGNVGIGITTPTVKLTIPVPAYAAQMTLGSATGVAFGITSAVADGNMYGLYAGVNSSGKSWIQGGRTDTATAYDISLQAAGGNVGIGTTTPTGVLHVNGISAGNAATIINQAGAIGDIFTASSSGTPRFVINNAGNVGIGTALPATVFHSYKSGTGNNTIIENSGASGWIQFKENGSSRGYMGFGDDGHLFIGASADSLGIVANNALHFGSNGTSNVDMTIDIGGNVGIGTTTPTGVFQVNGIAAGNAAAIINNAGAIGDIFTASSSGASKFVITNAGNVGIGTALPAGKLDITDAANTTSFNLTNNTATTLGAGINTTGVMDLQSTSLTTGNFMNLEVNALTTGKGVNVTSTSTALTTGSLMSLDWSPGSATAATGDLFKINIGANATTFTGNLLNVLDNSSSLFSVSKTAVTTSLPANFTAAGDVGMAYDLNFTNPTASYIKSAAPLYIQSGETFGSSDLTLKTYNSGNIIADVASTGSVLLAPNGGNVGIGTTAPATQLHVTNTIANSNILRLTGTANQGMAINFVENATPGTHVNWLIGAQTNVSNGFEITPSTAAGGTTFSTPVATFLSGGNVGIGTSTPTEKFMIGAARFFVHDAVDNNVNVGINRGATTNYGYLNFQTTATDKWYVGLTADSTDDFRINASGATRNFTIGSANVGIGTTVPGHKLQVAALTGAGDTRIRLSVGTNALDLINTETANYLSAEGAVPLYLRTSGTERITILSGGQVGIGITNPSYKVVISNGGAAGLEIDPTGAISTGAIGLQSYNRSGAAYVPMSLTATGSTQLYLNTTGNVGIGTTGPGAKLHVNGYTLLNNNNTTLALDSGNAAIETGIQFLNGGTEKWHLSSRGTFDTPNNRLSLFSGGTTEVLTVLTGGNVGIGTSSPLVALDVTGSASLSANISLKGAGTAHTFNYLDNGSLNFQRSPGGDAGVASVLYLGNNGNVGIGTAGPSAPLNIFVAGSSTVPQLDFTGTGSNWIKFAATGVNLPAFGTRSTGTKIVLYPDIGASSTDYAFGITGSTLWSSVPTTSQQYQWYGGTTLAATLTGTGNLTLIGNCLDAVGGVGGCTADYAEVYQKDVSDPLEAGDLLAINPNTGKITRASGTSSSMVGIFSESPASLIGQRNQSISLGVGTKVMEKLDPDEIPVALTGRVPTKVSTENGPIKAGDFLTYSRTQPGVAVKALAAGASVGKALAPYNGSGVGKIQVFVNVSYQDPEAYLADLGGFAISANPDVATANARPFILKNPAGDIMTRVGAFAELAVANLRVGAADIQSLTVNNVAIANNVTIGGLSLRDYIASVVSDLGLTSTSLVTPIASTDVIRTNVITPLASDTVVFKPASGSAVAKFEIQNASGSAVASIDTHGDATFSGTLRAGRIIADEIVGLNRISTATLSANYITNNYYGPNGTEGTSPTETNASNSATPSVSFLSSVSLASYSAELAHVTNLTASFMTVEQGLMALGPSSMTDLSVSNQLSIGTSLILSDNSINVLGADFEIQPLKQGGISLMGGLIYIDTNGNTSFGESATFAKDVTVMGTLNASLLSPIPNSDLVINLPAGSTHDSEFKINNASGSAVLSVNQTGDLIASGAATIGKLNFSFVGEAQATSLREAIATGSAGVAKVIANEPEITIRNPAITSKSLIYITPVGTASAQAAPYLIRQSGGDGFTVGVGTPGLTDMPFNWFIIN